MSILNKFIQKKREKMMESRLDTLVFNLTDENKKENNSKMFKTILNIFLVLLSFIFILVSYVAIKPLNDTYNQVNGSVSKGYFAILFVILLVVFVIFYILKKLNTSNILYFLLALGLLIKVMYMLYTPMNVRQYDTFSTNHNGHFDYTLYIYMNMKISFQITPSLKIISINFIIHH